MTLHRRDFLRRSAVGVLGLALTRCGVHEVQPLVAGVSLPFLTPVGDY